MIFLQQSDQITKSPIKNYHLSQIYEENVTNPVQSQELYPNISSQSDQAQMLVHSHWLVM